MRTGAIGGIATKYLARKDSSVLGLIGAGVQAKSQLSAISKVSRLEEVKVYDKEQRVVEQFKDVEQDYSFDFRACLKAEECVSGADVISMTTPSSNPTVKNEWISPGVHTNAIGADAPGKEELDPFILKRAKIVVGDIGQAARSGEINVPLEKGIIGMADIFAELDEVILGKKNGRASENEITVFDSTGLSLQDVATAHMVLEKAKQNSSAKQIWIV